MGKSNSALFLILFLFFFGVSVPKVSAQAPVSTDVGISARVGDEVIVVTPGGSLSGGISTPGTAVRFSGYAYPNALITLVKSGAENVSVFADDLGNFSITLPEVYDANIMYSLFAEDVLGNRSLIINYPLIAKIGFVTHLTGIKFPPTVVLDKLEVRSGDYLTVSGYALPNQSIEAAIEGPAKKIFSLTSGSDGAYKVVLPMTLLPKGDYALHVNYTGDKRSSKVVKFIIGNTNVLNIDSLLNIPGDCNSDKVINLVDFSVLAFWYGKDSPPACVDTNIDKKIDLVDFSILAFYWNG